MNCNKVNEISIISFLQSQGIEPVRANARDAWYLSPIRIENTPSFKVDVQLNRWYDHGLGQGGKLIDLGIRLLGVTVKEFLDLMQRTEFVQIKINKQNKHEDTVITLKQIKPIEHAALLKYLIFRNIPLAIARNYCAEIHYTIDENRFFGIGFKNDVGGIEIRNPYFKGCIGSKSITSILRDTQSFALFEGVFDFLSAIHLGIISDSESVIVLNSVNQLRTAITLLNSYSATSIKAFFDNDQAGRNCFSSLKFEFPFSKDCSSLYADYNDLNEMTNPDKKIKII